jgi:hypothetical protein
MGSSLTTNLSRNIPFLVLSEKIAQVLYQALCLIPAGFSDYFDGTNDWRTSNLFSPSAKVSDMLVQPKNLAVTSHNLCNSFFLFEYLVLIAIAANLQDHAFCTDHKAILHIKMLDDFSYQEQNSTSSYN